MVDAQVANETVNTTVANGRVAPTLRRDAVNAFDALEPFTGPLEASARADLEHELGLLSVPAGSILIREGEAGECLYFVMSGRLEVLVNDGSGQQATIAEIGPGESVGESALLTNEPRGATVRALQATELLRLSRAGFERLVGGHPRAMATFARTMASRLQRSLRQREPVRRLRVESLASAEDCRQIALTENLVLRNLKITQMYHRLSLDIARLVGQRDANWCTFAASASKTAGYSIRREDLPFIDAWRTASALPRFGRLFRELGRGAAGAARMTRLSGRIDAVLQGVSDAISEGNLKVFSELAPLFADFVQQFHDDTAYDRQALVRFLDSHLEPGATEAGGQDTLREALTHYYEAMFERSEKARAELILLANVKVGLHEQKRLQPEIARGLSVPLDVGLRGVMPVPGGELLERRLAESLRIPLRQALTRMMMSLRLPQGEVRLGRDVPAVRRAQMFPDVLRSLRNPELLTLLDELDDDTESTAGSRANDWASLEQRMNFIADLFRTRQRCLELFESPFEYDQRMEMASERVPAGRL